MKAKVLVILPSDKFLHRQMLEGILAYGHERGPWQFHFETGDRYEQGLDKVRKWGCNGIIALLRDYGQLKDMMRTRVPAVFINPPPKPGGAPSRPPKWATFVNRVQEDVGKSAAEYFIDRGFRSFAFVGTPRPADWCVRRLHGFSGRLAASGFGCETFPGAPEDECDDFDRESVYLSKWLSSLKPQTAIYASFDRRALQIISICSDMGIAIPESIMVLGTDNDEVDEIYARILHDFYLICREFDTKENFLFPAGVSTFGRQIEWAKQRLSTPFGAYQGAILAGNSSPTPGTDTVGATAVIHSYCKADLSEMVTGTALYINISPTALSGKNGVAAIKSLILGFVDLGGYFLQMDTVSADTLRAAQKDPKAYKTLSVRVSGWNARFVTLTKEWQDMIIGRTEHEG